MFVFPTATLLPTLDDHCHEIKEELKMIQTLTFVRFGRKVEQAKGRTRKINMKTRFWMDLSDKLVLFFGQLGEKYVIYLFVLNGGTIYSRL